MNGITCRGNRWLFPPVAASLLAALAWPSCVHAQCDLQEIQEFNPPYGSDAVAIDGDTAIVGTSDGVQFDFMVGAGYIYARDEGGADNWGEVANPTVYDGYNDFGSFGIAVSVDADTAVVGFESEYWGGFVTIFGRDEGGSDNWGQVAQFWSPKCCSPYFARDVAISGDTLVVADDYDGVAYVFERDEGGPDNWGHTATLQGANSPVSIDGNAVVTGEYNLEKAFVFERDEGGPDNWGMVAELPPLADFWIGASVAISGDVVFAGAGELNQGGTSAVQVFHRDEGGPDNWGEVATLTASDGASFFGQSVSVSGDLALIGAGDAAYLFRHQARDSWIELEKLVAADGAQGFGRAVSLSGGAALVRANESAFVFYLNCVVECPWDLNADGLVGPSDLILLLGSWGAPYGTADLIELLGNWGPCPK